MSDQAERMRAKGYVTAAEAATMIGRRTPVIYKMIDSGKVQGIQIGSSWYVQYASLLKYLGPQAVALLGLK